MPGHVSGRIFDESLSIEPSAPHVSRPQSFKLADHLAVDCDCRVLHLYRRSAGASAGLFLAILFPSYYAGVFELRSTGIADAVPLGVGLGLSQGIGGGALVGLAIDAIGVWYTTRKVRNSG